MNSKLIAVKLSKIEPSKQKGHYPLIEGMTDSMPTIGNRFRVLGESSVDGLRFVETSTVKSIVDKTNYMEIITENSVYRLEVVSPALGDFNGF